MKTLLIFILLIFTINSNAQEEYEGNITHRYDNGAIKTKVKTSDDPNYKEITHYYKSGKRQRYFKEDKTKGDYWLRCWDEPGNVLLDVVGEFFSEDPNYWVYAYKSYHTNGKLYQKGYFLNKKGAIGNYEKVEVWKTFSRDSILKDEIQYNYWNQNTNQFQKGISYYDNGQTKVSLEWDQNTRLFYFESYYKDGTRYAEIIFPITALIHENSSTLYQLLRTAYGMKNLVINFLKESEHASYTLYYPNGKPYSIKRKQSDKIINLDINGNQITEQGNNFPPLPKGTITCDLFPLKKNRKSCYWLIESSPPSKDGYYWVKNSETMDLLYFENGKMKGLQKYYHPNGILKESYNYIEGKKEGPYERKHINGMVYIKGNYTNNELDGPFEAYSEYGECVTKGKYSNGLQTGEWVTKVNVNINKKGTIKDEMYDGLVTFFNIDTAYKLYEGHMKGGIRVGDWLVYNLDLESGYPNNIDLFGVQKINYDDHPQEFVFKDSNDSEEEEIKIVVPDEFPIFPGCETSSNRRLCFQEKIKTHVGLNTKYPVAAQGMGVYGTIFVKFIIDKGGNITDIKAFPKIKLIEQSAYSLSDEPLAEEIIAAKEALKDEAIRVISRLPKMTPGKSKGNSISIPYAIPITFSYGNDD